MKNSVHFDPGQWPELWQAACRLLEQAIVPNQLYTWINPLEFLEAQPFDQYILVKIMAPNDFSAQWVKDRHKKDIEEVLTQVSGAKCKLEIQVKEETKEEEGELEGERERAAEGEYYDSSIEEEEPSQATLFGNGSRFTSHAMAHSMAHPVPHAGVAHGHSQASMSTFSVRAAPEEEVRRSTRNIPENVQAHAYHREVSPHSSSSDSMDPRYTFESFVVGASNQFAHASAIAVAEQPARQYNPLFLYSPPGLGKTHLLHAIGNRLMEQNPDARVAYLSAEKFVNELIDSLQHRRMSQFRSKYRDSYDMILIDDIQFIAGKNTSEEEFFHTFNALHSSKRQIVVTSDRPPKEIEGLEERVRTRFEWGLVADISPPEIETRIAILKAKAERDDIYLPDDVATFLATHIKSNVRELEGVLIRLQAQASLSGAEISLEMAKQELKNAIPDGGPNFTVDSIQNAVAKHYHIKIQDLKSTTRIRAVSLPRQIAMYLIRKYTGLGFKEIGQFFGGKDHTTILHACQKIEGGMEKDEEISGAVEAIQNLL